MHQSEFTEVVSDFIANIDSLSYSAPMIVYVVDEIGSKLSHAHNIYLEEHCEIESQTEESKTYKVPIERQARLRTLRGQIHKLKISRQLIPQNFLVSYVSEFDAFLGALLRVIYLKKPELLNDNSRQITYTDLLEFDSLDDAKGHVLEKEVETILRKSHVEHFSILENKFTIELRKGLSIWSEFIEITERRNLFVHTNGIVSDQYIKVCKEHGVDVSDTNIGDELSVSADYLKRAKTVIFEISVKLAHVLWRKLFPDERSADNNLNNVCFNLISNEKNSRAIDLLEFAVSLPKHHNETTKRMMVINLAQAYKWSDKSDKCSEVIKRFDWSATDYLFQLALAVLEEDYEKSANILEAVVNSEDLKEKEVIEWPLFNEFRKTNEFLEKFKELFGQDYAERESLIDEEFNNHIENIFTLKVSTGNENEDTPTEEQKSLNIIADAIRKNISEQLSN